MIAPTIRDDRACGAVFTIDADAASITALRHSVAAALRRWKVAQETVETMELLASELVTNAVQHAKRPAVGRSGGRLSSAAVWVRVRMCGQAIILEVWDGDSTPPMLRGADLHEDECGRGLMLVHALADQCGYYWPSAGGKVVWAQMVTK